MSKGQQERLAALGETVKLKDAYTNAITKNHTYMIAVEIANTFVKDGSPIPEDMWTEEYSDWINLANSNVRISKKGIGEDNIQPDPKSYRLNLEHQKPPKEHPQWPWATTYPTFKKRFYFVACLTIRSAVGIV